MKSLLKYPGAKWNLVKWIIDKFPEEYEKMTYLEPYFGSGAIFFNKKRSKIETINDLDSRVVNFFTAVRDNPDELSDKIQMTPWSREEYKKSYEVSEDCVEDARRFLVRLWQGIGAKTSDITGWSNNIKPLDSGKSRWSRLSNIIVETAERLSNKNGQMVQIENSIALDLIRRYNFKYVFMYLDPPYLMSTRNKRLYANEMSYKDHVKLIREIRRSKAKIMLSGYNNDLYNKYLSSWYKFEVKATTEFGKSAQEVIWCNYKPDFIQTSLFD